MKRDQTRRRLQFLRCNRGRYKEQHENGDGNGGGVGSRGLEGWVLVDSSKRGGREKCCTRREEGEESSQVFARAVVDPLSQCGPRQCGHRRFNRQYWRRREGWDLPEGGAGVVAMVSEGRRPHAEPVAAGSVWSVWRVWRVSVMVVVVVVSCVLRGRLRSELSSRLGAGFLLSTDIVSCWSLEFGGWSLEAGCCRMESGGQRRIKRPAARDLCR